MRKHSVLIGLLAVMAGSCTTELDEPRESAVPETFHATIYDNTGHEATRTFTDESLLVRWNKEDHISVFNGNTAATEFDPRYQDGYTWMENYMENPIESGPLFPHIADPH